MVGDFNSDDFIVFKNCVVKYYLLNKIIIICDGISDKFMKVKLEFLNLLIKKDGKAIVYVCENYICDFFVIFVVDLERVLKVNF